MSVRFKFRFFHQAILFLGFNSEDEKKDEKKKDEKKEGEKKEDEKKEDEKKEDEKEDEKKEDEKKEDENKEDEKKDDEKFCPSKLYRFIRFFSQKMCNGIALIDTFLSIAAHHC